MVTQCHSVVAWQNKVTWSLLTRIDTTWKGALLKSILIKNEHEQALTPGFDRDNPWIWQGASSKEQKDEVGCSDFEEISHG